MGHKRAKRSIREANRTKAGTDRAPSQQDQMDGEKLPKNAMRILMSAQTREDYRKRKRDEQAGAGASGAKAKILATSESTGQRSQKKSKANPATKSGASAQAQAQAHSQPAKASSSKLTILPGESLLHFNRRVEDSLRASVSVAARSAQAHSSEIERQEREARKAKHAARLAGQEADAQARKKAKAEKEERADDDDDVEDDDSEAGAAPAPPGVEVKKEVAKKKAPEPVERKDKQRTGPTDFAKATPSSAPKRLNDIAMAPPQLTLPRLASRAIASNQNAKKGGGGEAAGARVGLSAAQTRILEEERERVIARYRELKERKGLKAVVLEGH